MKFYIFETLLLRLVQYIVTLLIDNIITFWLNPLFLLAKDSTSNIISIINNSQSIFIPFFKVIDSLQISISFSKASTLSYNICLRINISNQFSSCY